jgi:hypothetical protein
VVLLLSSSVMGARARLSQLAVLGIFVRNGFLSQLMELTDGVRLNPRIAVCQPAP